jgi:hypothetical protein
MDSSFNGGSRTHNDAKEYERFCRFRRLFLVDGLEPWRAALKARGLTEGEINAKVSSAADFIKSMGESSSELQEA